MQGDDVVLAGTAIQAGDVVNGIYFDSRLFDLEDGKVTIEEAQRQSGAPLKPPASSVADNDREAVHRASQRQTALERFPLIRISLTTGRSENAHVTCFGRKVKEEGQK